MSLESRNKSTQRGVVYAPALRVECQVVTGPAAVRYEPETEGRAGKLQLQEAPSHNSFKVFGVTGTGKRFVRLKGRSDTNPRELGYKRLAAKSAP
jgi:hypothetical protein